MIAQPFAETGCPRCAIAYDSDCARCMGDGHVRVDVGPPVELYPAGRLHAYVTERIADRIERVLVGDTGAEHTARWCASWLSHPSLVLRLGRAGVVERVGANGERVWRAYLNALTEHAAVLRGESWKHDGSKRRGMEHAAHELEALARALGAEELR